MLFRSVDDNYEPRRLDELDSQDEDEEDEVEETPLPILDRMRINSPIPSSEQGSSKPYSSSTRDSLERHLGSIIEETFRDHRHRSPHNSRTPSTS